MRSARWSTLTLAIWLATASLAWADDRAETLYYRGLAEVEATLPSSNLALPSTAMPCVNCHGADGRGGREGGVAVPPISWRRLSMATADRPAYDESLLARALRDGLGADGASLHEIMPRYAVSEALALDLAGWLDAIGPAHETGVTADGIVIAIPSTKTATPSTKTNVARAAVVAKVLRFYADNVDRNGGLYGRTLRLVEDEPGREGVFARLAALGPIDDDERATLDLWPLHAEVGGRSAFPLIPSDDRLMRSLLKAAKRDDSTAKRLSVLTEDQDALPRTLVFDGTAEGLSALVNSWSGPESLTIYTTPDHIDLSELQHLSPRPLRIVLANPFASDRTNEGRDAVAFERAAERLGLSEIERPMARAAWVAASLLEQALRATGRQLNQQRFEAALRSMTTVESGLLPPVNPTRGLTSIGLITFDFASGKVTRLEQALN